MQKVAIVTGSGRNIGRSCAIELTKAGFAIALVDLLENDMEETAATIRAAGGIASTHVADVADYKRAREVVSLVLQTHGRIDFLLNNAGLSNGTGILDITEEQFDRTISVNLKSCFNYIHHAAPAMLAQGSGRIVSMSSLAALSGGVTAAISKFSYAAAKAGIMGMTRSLAKELGPGHTIVTVLCDYGTRYQSKLFNPDFLRAHNLPTPEWLERRNNIVVPLVSA